MNTVSQQIRNKLYTKSSICNILKYHKSRKIVRINPTFNMDLYANQPINYLTYTHSVEHIVPQSFVNEPTHSSDMHNMWLTHMKLNAYRCNYRYSALQTRRSSRYVTNTGVVTSQPTDACIIVDNNRRSVSIKHNRGAIARTIGYYHIQYPDLSCILEHILPFNLMLRWNNRYKVSEIEQMRNKYIQSIQNNSNPFVDNPLIMNDAFRDRNDDLRI